MEFFETLTGVFVVSVTILAVFYVAAAVYLDN